MASCTHQLLGFDAHDWGKDGYKQPSAKLIREALQVNEPAKKKQKTKAKALEKQEPRKIALPSEQTFPAPMVEHGDELYHDPDYPPQSLQDWIDEDARNDVTTRRRTVYVVPPPEIDGEVAFMEGWQSAQLGRRKAAASMVGESSIASDNATETPRVEDVAEYLQAFYHGLPVKVLNDPALRFMRWEEGSKSKAERQTVKEVALATGDEAIRIACRPSLDKVFKGQLNLNDLLDVAISILPADAYALLMLVNQDLYEDEEDDFCCGRAYGGSRVAVVSSARYRPDLDAKQSVDREHSWPASHCRVSSSQKVKGGRQPHGAGQNMSELYPGSALAAGVDAFTTLPSPSTVAQLSTLWLGRVCKTASHELGHCFGIDHCIYYACIMQGTANIAEDSRQPPYLCPVDLAKVSQATGATDLEHYNALSSVCERWAEDKMFAAFGAWVRVRLQKNSIM